MKEPVTTCCGYICIFHQTAAGRTGRLGWVCFSINWAPCTHLTNIINAQQMCNSDVLARLNHPIAEPFQFRAWHKPCQFVIYQVRLLSTALCRSWQELGKGNFAYLSFFKKYSRFCASFVKMDMYDDHDRFSVFVIPRNLKLFPHCNSNPLI